LRYNRIKHFNCSWGRQVKRCLYRYACRLVTGPSEARGSKRCAPTGRELQQLPAQLFCAELPLTINNSAPGTMSFVSHGTLPPAASANVRRKRARRAGTVAKLVYDQYSQGRTTPRQNHGNGREAARSIKREQLREDQMYALASAGIRAQYLLGLRRASSRASPISADRSKRGEENADQLNKNQEQQVAAKTKALRRA